jgi:hypothetical protein
MRFIHAVLLVAVSASPAFAQREPQIVIPGKPGVPVYINGVDASWAVVEGQFGLDRPGAMTPVVTYQPLPVSVPEVVPGYFPRDGRRPGYGRLEVVPPPNRPLPPPAPSFSRSWSSQSAPGPVTQYAPYQVPPVVVAPRFGRNRPSHHASGAKPNNSAPSDPSINPKDP